MVGSDAAAVDGRLFLVGDFKQSIYRFRGADPALFRQFREPVPDAGRRNLTENFRSVPGILSFVNALFADTFTEAGSALKPGGGITATERAARRPVLLGRVRALPAARRPSRPEPDAEPGGRTRPAGSPATWPTGSPRGG